MNPLRLIAIVTATLLLLGTSGPGYAQEAQLAQSGAPKPAGVATPTTIKFAPNLTVSALAGRPDTDLVEFSPGRRMRVGDLRRLAAVQQQIRAAQPGSRLPAALRVKPAATGTRINTAADLATALRRPDGETVQLPSGRLATVGQIKLVEPLVEKRTGRKLAALSQRPSLSGPAIRVTDRTTQSDWVDILQKSPGTVLESPHGKRITVGELKQYLAQTPKAGAAPPTKTGPALTPKQR